MKAIIQAICKIFTKPKVNHPAGHLNLNSIRLNILINELTKHGVINENKFEEDVAREVYRLIN